MNQSLIKTGAAALTALSLTLGGFASAAAELAAPQRTPTAEPNSLQISYDQGTFQGALQAALTGSGDAASPSLETSALTVDGSGFSTVYAYTSLSEVVDHYWDVLTRLGFEGTASVTEADASYTFRSGELWVKVVFSQQADTITADLSWLQARAG